MSEPCRLKRVVSLGASVEGKRAECSERAEVAEGTA